jgi:ligand-binding SRPBCC domain-containing protein
MHRFTADQWLPVSPEEAWQFFSSPKNLSKITPPKLDFHILTDLDGKEIYNGMLIDYKVRPLFGIQMHWQTEIFKVEKPFIFADRQLKGPYKVWVHTHIFKEDNGGVMMTDIVDYAVPLGPLGKLVNALIVKREIEKIFEFRRKTLDQFFKTPVK